jgi:hypothetical protein
MRRRRVSEPGEDVRRVAPRRSELGRMSQALDLAMNPDPQALEQANAPRARRERRRPRRLGEDDEGS